MASLGDRRDVGRAPARAQYEYYTANAAQYDETFVREGDEHFVALNFISALLDGLDYHSVLDVGAGTGRGVRYLRERHPDLDVRGIEPVPAMIEHAERVHELPVGCIIEGDGTALPFDDDSFDVVCEFGVLHHVERPERVVAEMARVARRAVFLSDENRFGRGGTAMRIIKFSLYHFGLWPIAYRLIHRGKPYNVTEGDGGISYSYSVYDSLPALDSWADRAFLVPTVPARASWFHPLFGATHLLLCALRDP